MNVAEVIEVFFRYLFERRLMGGTSVVDKIVEVLRSPIRESYFDTLYKPIEMSPILPASSCSAMAFAPSSPTSVTSLSASARFEL